MIGFLQLTGLNPVTQLRVKPVGQLEHKVTHAWNKPRQKDISNRTWDAFLSHVDIAKHLITITAYI